MNGRRVATAVGVVGGGRRGGGPARRAFPGEAGAAGAFPDALDEVRAAGEKLGREEVYPSPPVETAGPRPSELGTQHAVCGRWREVREQRHCEELAVAGAARGLCA